MSAQPGERFHERTDDGRDRHLFTKVDGLWVCDCGESRDRFGRPVETRLSVVAATTKEGS